jgi:hypothetical protein
MTVAVAARLKYFAEELIAVFGRNGLEARWEFVDHGAARCEARISS